jgi:hypothetical protein
MVKHFTSKEVMLANIHCVVDLQSFSHYPPLRGFQVFFILSDNEKPVGKICAWDANQTQKDTRFDGNILSGQNAILYQVSMTHSQ